MKKTPLLAIIIALTIICFSIPQYGCNESSQPKADSAVVSKTMSHAELLERGKYIVTAAACNDCHSPKIFTPQGIPVPDSTRLLSGHPASSPAMPIDKKALTPGYWVLVGPDLTSFFGPWGISYGANLTPDSTTGLGAWTEDVFIRTIRTGKHLGQEGGRAILPAMPWPSIAQYSDQDLKAIFTYLQALPPVKNKVPAPVYPADIAKMN
ncbi:MAG TPA: hypothetical protein VMH01_16335 [Puia sp.]|nr:hypothetical protein [Puia sp.]